MLPASGSNSTQLMDWYQLILTMATILWKPRNIQSIVLIKPLWVLDTWVLDTWVLDTWVLDTAPALKTESVFQEAWPNWKCTMISFLYNVPHGGALETQHQVLCLTYPGIADKWDNPQATMEMATGMEHMIDFHHQQAMIPQMLQLSNTTNAALPSTADDYSTVESTAGEYRTAKHCCVGGTCKVL
jgi:hypothetical protein